MIVMMLVIKVTITLLLTMKEGDPISLVNLCRDGFSWGLNIASTDVTVETEELVCNSLQHCNHFTHVMRFHVVLIVKSQGVPPDILCGRTWRQSGTLSRRLPPLFLGPRRLPSQNCSYQILFEMTQIQACL